jgi:hypothetical protein
MRVTQFATSFDASLRLGKTARAKSHESDRLRVFFATQEGDGRMRKRLVGAAFAIAATLAMSSAHAQSAAQIAAMEAKFAASDKDGDGKLTPDEAKAGMPRVSTNFAKIDKGNKGFVTVEDIKDAMSAMMGK